MFEKMWNLQLFAEEAAETAPSTTAEGDAAAEAATEAPAGTTGQSSEQAAPSATAPRKSFRELLQDEEYRKEYDDSVGRAVKRRMRSQQKALSPMLGILGQQYGVDTSDLDNPETLKALVEAVVQDDSRLAEKAMERGYSVEDMRTVLEAERVVAERKAENEQAERERFFSELAADGAALRAEAKDFDYAAAMARPEFARLAVSLKANGVANPVQAAYRALHYDALVQAKVTEAEEKARQAISQSIQSGMSRPRENGAAQAAAQLRIDPRNLSAEQRREIRKRISNGEHIKFG